MSCQKEHKHEIVCSGTFIGARMLVSYVTCRPCLQMDLTMGVSLADAILMKTCPKTCYSATVPVN